MIRREAAIDSRGSTTETPRLDRQRSQRSRAVSSSTRNRRSRSTKSADGGRRNVPLRTVGASTTGGASTVGASMTGASRVRSSRTGASTVGASAVPTIKGRDGTLWRTEPNYDPRNLTKTVGTYIGTPRINPQLDDLDKHQFFDYFIND